MDSSRTRRRFLRDSSCLAGTIIGGASLLPGLPSVSADEAQLNPKLLRFDDSIESLVQLIETSPRKHLLERVAAQIRAGRSYKEVLAALLLAGIRNVQPRPAVGFKFHCVLVVNSCHLASMAGPDQDRWLPIFWALDYFKSSQADEGRSSGWRMSPVNESLVPDAKHAHDLFVDAMDTWDVEKADVATAGLVRTMGSTEVFNELVRYAARDYRSIGHKAIYLANAWRTLQVIGWQYAEPVLRSLVFAMLNHQGQQNPSQNDYDADRPWRENAKKIADLPESWLDGKIDDAVPQQLLQAFRGESPGIAADVAVDALTSGAAPDSVWDGVFVGAGELLMRQPGIIGLHGLTTANAMHFLWRSAADDSVRRQLLLQACSFNSMFRDSAKGRGKLADVSIDSLKQVDIGGNEETLAEILADISGNQKRAAEKTHAYLTAGGSGHELVTAARRVLFTKGRNAHDYKFTSAVLEDFDRVSPSWRAKYLAMSVFNLKGSGHPDSGLLNRTRAALEG